MFGAPEKTKPTSYEENSHRFPARPTALLALWVPFGREFAVTRRWVRDIPYRSAPRKKGDTIASSRDPQSILGLPSASFCFLTRHFMEWNVSRFLLNRDRSRAPCDLICRTVELTGNWRCSRSQSDPAYTNLLQILPSTRRLQFVRHGADDLAIAKLEPVRSPGRFSVWPS